MASWRWSRRCSPAAPAPRVARHQPRSAWACAASRSIRCARCRCRRRTTWTRCRPPSRCASSSTARGWRLPDFEVDAGNARGAGRDLPPARRHRAGHRAGRGARDDAVGGRDRRTARRPLPPAHRRQPRPAAPPDAAGGDAVELRAADAPAQQRLLRQVSVFAGGWTLPAAAEVGADRRRVRGAGAADARCTTSRCSSVDREVAARRARATGCWRRCASTRWSASTNAAKARPHAAGTCAHCVALAEEAAARVRGPDQDMWIGRLQAGARQPDRGDDLVLRRPGRSAVGPAAGRRHRLLLGLEQRRAGLPPRRAPCWSTTAGGRDTTARESARLRALARLSLFRGRYEEALSFAQQALAAARRLGAPRPLALGAPRRWASALEAAGPQRARRCRPHEDALEMARR